MLDDMAFKQKMVRQVYSSCFRRLAPLHVSSEKGKKNLYIPDAKHGVVA
jgi:hypothetical protein